MEKVKNFFVSVGRKIKQGFYNEFVDTWKGITKESISFPILLLVSFNIVFLLIANIIAVKTIPFGSVGKINFGVPAAVVVYILGSVVISDILCEIDPSSKWTRRSCHLGFLLNLIMVAIFEISIAIPGNVAGIATYKVVGENYIPTDGLSVLGTTYMMLLASASSFYIGDLVNDCVFKKLRNKDGEGNGKLVKRCVLSTVFGQLLDATIFIALGLQLLPGLALGITFTGGSSLADPIGWANMGVMIGLQWVIKVLIEFIVSPLVILICNKYKKSHQEEL